MASNQENTGIKGYKVFYPDWTCNGGGVSFQYEVGKTFEEDVVLSVCNRGFHFCEKVADCFNYYAFDPHYKVAEIIALGDICKGDDKCCTNKIKIVREISWQDVLDLVNTGNNCSGIGNSGNHNSGNHNSGYCNSGNRNSGDYNSEDYNSGDYNSGYCNSGNFNSGYHNGGNGNSGNHNSGSYNSGNHNSGNCNKGDYNSGDFNNISCASGCFNTKKQQVYFFDEPTDMTMEQWDSSDARAILLSYEQMYFVSSDDMTDKEKEEHPKYTEIGGYITRDYAPQQYGEWWDGLSLKAKNIIKAIPNFDAEKFSKITGIDAEAIIGN